MAFALKKLAVPYLQLRILCSPGLTQMAGNYSLSKPLTFHCTKMQFIQWICRLAGALVLARFGSDAALPPLFGRLLPNADAVSCQADASLCCRARKSVAGAAARGRAPSTVPACAAAAAADLCLRACRALTKA